MSNLWVKVAVDDEPDFSYSKGEEHYKHALHPAFEAAGIRHAPCAASYCPDVDHKHADAFDRAEEQVFDGLKHRDLPVEHMDLSKPLYGYETTADMHTIRRYTHHPQTRKGLPTVFRHEGGHYIMDGHHGLSGALRRGDTHTDVQMVDLDKED